MTARRVLVMAIAFAIAFSIAACGRPWPTPRPLMPQPCQPSCCPPER